MNELQEKLNRRRQIQGEDIIILDNNLNPKANNRTESVTPIRNNKITSSTPSPISDHNINNKTNQVISPSYDVKIKEKDTPKNIVEKKELLGKGSFGSVYRGILINNNNSSKPIEVAVKIVCSVDNQDEIGRELYFLRTLKNPFIVNYYRYATINYKKDTIYHYYCIIYIFFYIDGFYIFSYIFFSH